MPSSNSLPALFLMGPTASGKTGLALAFCKAVSEGRTPFAGAEIISVDSAQVFRGMDIGTAKPSLAERAGIAHHLLDILDPAESYSVARFCEDALRTVAEVRARGHLPLLVGGTGLYFRALEQGLSSLPEADPAIRAGLAAEAAVLGWPALHVRLAELDPASAARIKPHDQQRIQRALEIHQATGRPRSEHWAGPRTAGFPGPLVKFALSPLERSDLHQAIEQRFQAMMTAGLLDEVRQLYTRGDLHPGLPSIRAVGYRQLWEHLAGRLSHSTAVEHAIIATRQYAKRQITWLRSEKNLGWLDARSPDALEQLLHGMVDASKRL